MRNNEDRSAIRASRPRDRGELVSKKGTASSIAGRWFAISRALLTEHCSAQTA